MKKVAVSLMAVGAAFMLLAPQDASAGLVGKGVKVGLNISNVTGDDADFSGADKKSRVNLAIGGFVTFGLGDTFAIQPELMYVGGGAKYEAQVGSGSLDRKVSFLDIPVLVKYNIPMEGSVKPSVYLGPALGIILSAEDEDQDGKTTDIKDDLESTNFSLVFGVGANISSVTVDLRYGLGLSSIVKDDDTTTPATTIDVKTAGFMILVGYSF